MVGGDDATAFERLIREADRQLDDLAIYRQGRPDKGESDQNRNSNARRQSHSATICARVSCQRRYVVPVDLCCQIAAAPCFGERQAGSPAFTEADAWI